MSNTRPGMAGQHATAATVTIRRASEGDIPAIQDIARKAWADTYRDVIPLEAQDKILSRAYSREALTTSIGRGQAFLVAEDTSNRVGFAAGKMLARLLGYVDIDFDGTQFNLHRLYIMPDSQRSGLGRMLLSEAVRALAPDFVPPNERWFAGHGEARRQTFKRTPAAATISTQVPGPTPVAAPAAATTSTQVAGPAAAISSAPVPVADATPTAATTHAPVPLPGLPSIPPGTHRLIAHVERDNPKARAFYSKMGFSENKEENVVIGGTSLPLVRISVELTVG